ncbi:TPA_asm: hypothetical protein G3V02_003431 [Salmonella enterica subsp. enterica serovar Ank]|uniref:Uncharacterized protein n=1 Tax=Salmonella enterica subsp. enterica serovar Ank TaxID=1173578 RepID=A0A727BFW4_SALET|nr:hypothetical protein [Salmonella enterica subsp. enterica serovar Ank]
MDKIKSSTKKVLGGICVFLILIFVKLVSSEFGKEYANDYTNKFLYPENEQVNKYINDEFRKHKFPIVVGENIKWIAASAQGMYINYYYIVNDFDEGLFDAEDFQREFRKNFKKQSKFCDLLKNYKYTARYNNRLQSNNKALMTIDMTYKDCQ